MIKFDSYTSLVVLATMCKFHVTSTNGGKHNVNSAHYKGKAIDVRTRDKTDAEIDWFISVCKNFNLKVRDERKKPIGQKVWTGAHLHIEIV